MILVSIESPYAGNVEANLDYARLCVADSLKRGEAPIASHLLYTQPGILNDNIPEERMLGIQAGIAWNKHAEITAVYADYGVTDGMRLGINAALREGRKIEYRSILP